jgi:hypothetical protein
MRYAAAGFLLMGMVLVILGVGNLAGMQGNGDLRGGVGGFGLLVNVGVFLVPGLISLGLGWVMYRVAVMVPPGR